MYNPKEKTIFGFVNKHNRISEFFLHYIWQNKLFNAENLTDDNNNEIKIVSPGIKNKDAGPDFFNAKIKIGNTIWAGNVEIHLNASDWYKHNHHKDKAYNNVILHVVADNDSKTISEDGKRIPSFVLNYEKKLSDKYTKLINNKNTISCNNYIVSVDKLILNTWLSRLLIERAEQKTEYAKSLLEFKNNNWEEIFYIITARSFGFKVNALPFELLAKSLPSTILAKHKNNKFQIEALLFGQAGMLKDNTIKDYYFSKLKKEYNFLKKKYKLSEIENYLWKFLRIRPSNFPTVRISQFADLIYKSSHLFSKVIETKSISELEKIFDIKSSEYWNTHYKFGKESSLKEKRFGKSAVRNILINTIIPILFLYGKEKNKAEISEKAINFLENLKPEKNNITKKWENSGTKIKNAYFSQALIQLYNEYCIKKRCLDCRIGHQFIQNK